MVSELPTGWSKTTLSEISVLSPKSQWPDDSEIGFVPMSHAPTHFRGLLRHEARPWHEVKKSYTHFEDGDVIFAKVTPCFENGKAALVSGLPNGAGAGSSEFHVLRPRSSEISAGYLLALIKGSEFLRAGEKSMTGAVGLRRVPRAFVEQFPVPLPPAAEQKRIAQKLDALLAQVDTLKARIDAIPAALNRFRESAIESATTGALTETWRQNHGTGAHWNHKPLGELASPMEQGWSPKCDPVAVLPGGSTWAVIKTTAIQPARFNPDENKRLPENLKPRPHLCIEIGDILITRAGPRTRAAVCCYVDSSPINLMLCDKAYRFRAIDDVYEGELLALILNSPTYKEKLDSLKTGISESGVNLTMRKLQALELPQPPLAEQKEILRRLKTLLSFADQLEAKVNAAQKRIDTLTQSLLAKAFRGELVPQDPNDEPASVLLDRIRAQRAAAPKPKRGRKAAAG